MVEAKLFRKGLGRVLVAGVTGLLLAGPVQAAENLRLSTFGPGSSVYVVMTTFANIANEKVPNIQIQVDATGAATRHVVETAMDRSDFAMMSPSMAPMMQNGAGPFGRVPNSDELLKNLRLVMTFPLGYYHVTTFANSGIERFEDLKGKRVFLGPPGGVGRTLARRLVEGLTGFKPGEDYTSVDLSWDAAAQSFQDGQIDVYINPTLPPSPVIMQIATLRDIRIIGLPDELPQNDVLQDLLNRPGGIIGVIPAGAYGSGQVNTEDVRALASIGGIVTRRDVSEETIYQTTKAFWENISARAGNTPILRNLSLQEALDEANVPLHPGALRYYREVNLDIPDDLIPPEAES